MFQQTFLQTPESNRKPFSLGLSLLLQVAVVGFLAVLPLLYEPGLPSMQLRTMLLAPHPPTAPVANKAVVPAGRIPTGHRFAFHPDSLNRMSKSVTKTVDMTPAPGIEIPGAIDDPNAAASSILSAVGNIPQFAPQTPKPVVTQTPPRKPVRVGSIIESNLIHKVQPVYPPLARSARVSGTVEFSAIISRDGLIENLQLLRGHPLLVNAAREAILQWRYKPTILNGQPVEVITNIIVSFNLN